jgi:DNA-binding SARP family transcriptional activator
MEQNNTEDMFDLGAWLGRKQAFTLIAGRCSAATVVCLRKIREGKRYRALGLTWEQFCRQRAERSLRSALADLERLAATRLDTIDQQKLSITLAAARDSLDRISLSVRV